MPSATEPWPSRHEPRTENFRNVLYAPRRHTGVSLLDISFRGPGCHFTRSGNTDDLASVAGIDDRIGAFGRRQRVRCLRRARPAPASQPERPKSDLQNPGRHHGYRCNITSSFTVGLVLG